MSGDTADTWVLEAARGACVRVRAARWSVLTVRSGYAWITVERDAADYWLAPGEAVPLAAGERVWIGGWDDAVCCELAPLVPVMRPVPLPALAARFKRWLKLPLGARS